MAGQQKSTTNYGGRIPQVQMQAVQVQQVQYPNQMGVPAQPGYPQPNPAYPQQQPMYANQMPGMPVVQMQGAPVVQANAQMYPQAPAQTRQF